MKIWNANAFTAERTLWKQSKAVLVTVSKGALVALWSVGAPHFAGAHVPRPPSGYGLNSKTGRPHLTMPILFKYHFVRSFVGLVEGIIKYCKFYDMSNTDNLCLVTNLIWPVANPAFVNGTQTVCFTKSWLALPLVNILSVNFSFCWKTIQQA